jgi:hypothetical protein
MPVGQHNYLALPPPPRRFVATAYSRIEGADREARFEGRGRSAQEAGRELAAALSAWREEAGERAQAAWQGAEDRLRES